MEKEIYAVRTLYHLQHEQDYVRTVLSSVQKSVYEVCIRYSPSITFEDVCSKQICVIPGLHEALNRFRECYLTLLQEGYCYFGFIPEQRNEWERTAEKNRLFKIVKDYAHPEAFNKLKKWRDAEAALDGVHPSSILNKRGLSSLATFLPQNREELTHCPGIGEKVVNVYSRKLLKICSQYERLLKVPLYSILPKYKYKAWDEERFLPFRRERLVATNPFYTRQRALDIGNTGVGVDELSELSLVQDQETRRRVASAANKLRLPHITKSIVHLLFDEGPQVRQYMLRAIISSELWHEFADDVAKLIAMEPKAYNQSLCRKIMSKVEEED